MPKLSFQYVRHGRPETLVEFLCRRFRYHTGAEWERLVREGAVTVGERRVLPTLRLQNGHRIRYEPPPAPEPEIDPTYRVLYEDAELLAVEKSGNIPTSPSGKYWEHCLVRVLQRGQGLPALHAVHRLDRETSGVNLFAKSREAAARLGEDFHQGRVRKAYAAILRGRLRAARVYASAPLGPEPGGTIRIKQAVVQSGRPACTEFILRAVLPGASLVAVLPRTGRTHQIRAHAAYLGHPVWGDKLYGAAEADFLAWVQTSARSGRERHLLHATELAFQHPVSGREVVVRSPEAVLMALFLDRQASPPHTSGRP